MQFVNSDHWEEDAYRFQSAELASLEDFIPKLLEKGEKFSYVYDMGDHWEHEILVENIEDSLKDFFGAVCLDGEGACPPEDVGGPPGYYEFVEAIQDPTSEKHHRYNQWLGYAYDPGAFDLHQTNQFIQDHFYVVQLSQDTYWSRKLPLYHPHVDFVSRWINQLTPAHRQYAQDLAFRSDMVNLLTYLRDHKVRGTKASGNFPRKDIRAIAGRFAEPPILDQKIGDRIYKLQTEDEVPDLLFIHIFANIAGLIMGGENLLWRVTQLGKMFLGRTPAEQAWFLIKVWFYQFNWEYCYPFEDVQLNKDLLSFQIKLLNILLGYPTGKPVGIDKLIHDIDRALPGWNLIHGHISDINSALKYFLLSIVVEPFEKLGLFEVIKESEELDPTFVIYTDIIITDYGKSLMRNFV